MEEELKKLNDEYNKKIQENKELLELQEKREVLTKKIQEEKELSKKEKEIKLKIEKYDIIEKENENLKNQLDEYKKKLDFTKIPENKKLEFVSKHAPKVENE